MLRSGLTRPAIWGAKWKAREGGALCFGRVEERRDKSDKIEDLRVKKRETYPSAGGRGLKRLASVEKTEEKRTSSASSKREEREAKEKGWSEQLFRQIRVK